MNAGNWQSVTKCGVLLVLVGICVGCGTSQPSFEPLKPASGKVMQGGKPLAGGVVRFMPVPDRAEFIINSLVDENGQFALTTVRTTDTHGERREGAPIGTYKVEYAPLVVDQTVANQEPVILPAQVTIEENDNTFLLDVPPARRR
ncbi:hypothetical protein ETAA8_61730 [Anatilimnocola aggregata]|uniref:Carboxypeptidase regulatory-like domain-containing protein n=1 Tax=Anatilimnocola aggregata TaxID=2528021 RepID=A0A517YLD8_9BACT|nr:hypothetical protein [Anatilimnocola aggregata]QDU31020.1 hypothetical protein ETAA8_61730 [Anatilimnocola aggregata]